MLFLIAIGIFTILPIVYSIVTSFKPLDELLAFPPKFFVVRPTLKNYAALPELISNLAVPLSRYVFNTIFVTVSITLIQVLLACMGAYVLCQVKNKATKMFFMV
ncbi:MAG: carbohydrate ABC transporter permease, partial [Acutalibacteraceae bacterium]